MLSFVSIVVVKSKEDRIITAFEEFVISDLGRGTAEDERAASRARESKGQAKQFEHSFLHHNLSLLCRFRIETSFFSEVAPHLQPVHEAVLVDHVDQDGKDGETVEKAGDRSGKTDDGSIVETIVVENRRGKDAEKKTDDLVGIFGEDTADEDGKEVLEDTAGGSKVDVDGDGGSTAGSHDLIDGDETAGDDEACDAVGDFIDTRIDGNLLVIDKGKLVIAEPGVAKSRSHDDADDDKERDEDNRFLEEGRGMGTADEVDVSGRTGSDSDDLGNTFIDKTHTKGDDNRRKLGKNQDDGMDEA